MQMLSKYGLLVLVLVLLLTLTTATRADLYGSPILDTGPFPCDAIMREQTWMNDSFDTMYIYLVRHWHGMSSDSKADFHSEIRRLSDNSLLSIFQNDRYANPSSSTHSDLAFPIPVLLNPGDGLKLIYLCNGFVGNPDGHVTVQIWWNFAP